MLPPHSPERTIDRLVREERGRILASLVKTLGDFQLAEDSLQEAVAAAIGRWREGGLPDAPDAWLLATARHRAIDRLRRDATFAAKARDIAYLAELEGRAADGEEHDIPDERLEMIFTCCHPAFDEKTRIALTLRTLGRLTTGEIAAAFLDRAEAMAQRLVRARRKIASAGIPYAVPDADVLPERVSSVLKVVYLVFNEGYSASAGASLTRPDLSEEAIRLARIIHGLMPGETETGGLLSLMLLHDSRRGARLGKDGAMIPLQEQDRALWNRERIGEGVGLLRSTLRRKRIGPYQLQAAVSAVHAESRSWDETDWPQIVALYDLLHDMDPSPVIRVNQAVALSYARGVREGLDLLDAVAAEGRLDRYQPYFAARGDLLSRSGDAEGAREAYRAAIRLSGNAMERAFLERRLDARPRGTPPGRTGRSSTPPPPTTGDPQ